MGDLLHLSKHRTVGSRCGMLRGTSATSWYERGCALEPTDPRAARAAYARALAGQPDLADAHNNLGRVLHALHDDEVDAGRAVRDDAVLGTIEAHYRLAICADATVGLYWFNLGVAVEDQGRIAEAITAYERAVELDASLADAHWNLARLLEVVGRSSDDEVVLRRAVRHLVRYRVLVA